MICTHGRINLAVNVFGALLLVTVLNSYIIHTKFHGEAERDVMEHFSKHIHVNKQPPRTQPPTQDPKLLSSNNPNRLHPQTNTLGGGGSQNSINNTKNQNNNFNNNQNNNNKNITQNNNSNNNYNNIDQAGKTDVKKFKPGSNERLKQEWATNPTRTDKGSKYPRDTCLPRHTTQQELLDLPLTVVTASSEGYVGHVHNIIGSVHTHQPDSEVVVYNLGFSEDTVRDLENYCGVTVRKFDLKQYPPHVASLKNFAWKALVVKQAVLDYGKILYLDSGLEIRRPYDFIKGRIEREGYFCIGMGDSLTRGAREAMFNFFNTSSVEYMGLPMIAGGVQGATFWGGAFEGIVLPAAECSLEPKCVTPARSGDEIRSFGKDQPLFSEMLYKGGCTQCAMSNAFTAHSALAAQAGDPFVAGRQHLFVRRGSGPFNGHGKRLSECPGRTKSNYQTWQTLRDQLNLNTTYLGNGGCPHTRFASKKEVDKLYTLGDVPKTVEQVVEKMRQTKITIVSSATSKNFDHLKALLDSVLEWEPKRPVVVYDIGLEDSQKTALGGYKGLTVTVEKLDMDPYPHMKDLSNMAWRPLVWATAYQDHGSFIYLNPSHVLYQRLDTFIYLLEKDGIFGATVGSDVLELYKDKASAAKFFESWPAVSKERRANGEKLMTEFAYKPTCTAKVTGFWKGSTAADLVLPPLFDCSTDETCWNNAKNSVGDARKTDQLLFSLMIYDKICYTCNRDYDFYAYGGKIENIIHKDHEYPLFAQSLLNQVQVVYDTVQD